MKRDHSNSQFLVAIAISIAIAAALSVAHTVGLTEWVELRVHDQWLSIQARQPYESPIAVVAVTEADIQALPSYPIPDANMAIALQKILEHEPRAIGIDVFRDKPVPPGRDQLNDVLANNENIFVIRKFGSPVTGEMGVSPPEVLADTEQVGFNDLVVDEDGIIRRALIFITDDQDNFHVSFAMRLAVGFLIHNDIYPEPDADNPDLMRLGKYLFKPFEPNDGMYVDADAAGHQFRLDFRSVHHLPVFSMGDLLADKLPDDALKGKVVVFGIRAVSVPIFHPTSANRRMPDVEIHGHITDQLIRSAQLGDQSVRPIADWQEIAVIVILSLVGGLLGWGVRSPWIFTASIVFGLTGWGIAIYGIFHIGYWLPCVGPAIAWLASAGIVTSYMSYNEKRDRAILMSLFGKHISDDVAKTIWANRNQILVDGRLESRGTTATVLFADLAGFTTISEQLQPVELMDWLNEFLGELALVVEAHGGMIRQYAGDALLCIFGVPMVHDTEAEFDEDAQRAVHCALAMRQRFDELRSRWDGPLFEHIHMRIGIQTGNVVVGSIGSLRRMEYSVIGDTVNTASRLESYDKDLLDEDISSGGCRILIGQPTLDRLNELFQTRMIAEIALRGKSQRLKIHGVIGNQVGR